MSSCKLPNQISLTHLSRARHQKSLMSTVRKPAFHLRKSFSFKHSNSLSICCTVLKLFLSICCNLSICCSVLGAFLSICCSRNATRAAESGAAGYDNDAKTRDARTAGRRQGRQQRKPVGAAKRCERRQDGSSCRATAGRVSRSMIKTRYFSVLFGAEGNEK